MSNWILQPSEDFKNKESYASKLNFLYKHDNVYVMDNHLAAGWAWLQELDVNKEYNLFHIDQHEDLVKNAPKESYEFIKDNPKEITIKNYCELRFKHDDPLIQESPVFQWDNYIKQIQELFPNWFNYCIFATHRLMISDSFLEKRNGSALNINPEIHSPFDLYNNIDYWIKQQPESWIINLDLDYFFSTNGIRIFSDKYIKACIENIITEKHKIAAFTIALSPECCGGWANAIEAMNIVSDVLELDFKLP